MTGGDFSPRGLVSESVHARSHCCLSVSLSLLLQVEPTEHTKKLLYQYETMMQLKKEEKLSRHQAWESELEVGSRGRGGRWEVAGVGRRLNYALPHFPIQVLEILKLREEEEEAHTLTLSIYDTKRNEKSREYREARVGLAPCPGPRPWREKMTRDSAGKACRGEEVTDTIVVILAAQLPTPTCHPREHSGARPGLPHPQGLWPSHGRYFTGKGWKSCTHLHLWPQKAASGHRPEFPTPCSAGCSGYTLRSQGPAWFRHQLLHLLQQPRRDF